jgi:hypothetical protein
MRALARFLVLLVFSLTASSFALLPAAIYYISPDGSDSGDGSEAKPYKTAKRAFKRGGGHTYIYKDGRYDHPDAMIDNPPNGTPRRPTVIKAENDGKAVLDGKNARSGIRLFSAPPKSPTKQHIEIEGFKVENCGERPAVLVSSQDGTPPARQTRRVAVRRTGAEGDIDVDNHAVWDVSRAREIELEDVWGWGNGRYVFKAYGTSKVTVRRAVFRWDGWGKGAKKSGDPKYSMGVYNSHDGLYENVLLLDAAPTSLGGEKGGLYLPSNDNGKTSPYTDTDDNLFVGVIALNNAGHGVAVEGGSGATNDDNRFLHLVSWGNTGHGVTVPKKAVRTVFDHATLGDNREGSYFGPARKSVSGSVLKNSLVVFNEKDGVDGEVETAHNNVFDNGTNYAGGALPGDGSFCKDPRLKSLLRPEAEAGTDKVPPGARVDKRSEGGRLTGQDLWPWPHQARIRADMCAEETRGFCGAASLTAYVQDFLEKDPPSARGGATQGLVDKPVPRAEAPAEPAGRTLSDPRRPAYKVILRDSGIIERARFGPDAAEVTIHDSEGDLVYRAARKRGKDLIWDGRDQEGKLLKPGVYMCRITGASGKISFHPIAIVQ